jgi:hypothetical protein
MNALHGALMALLTAFLLLYVCQRVEQTLVPFDLRQCKSRSLWHTPFPDFTIIYVADNKVIRFLSGLPISHIALVLKGNVVCISHTRGLEIERARRYCLRIFRKNASARILVQHYRGPPVAPRRVDELYAFFQQKKRVRYWHRYWQRGLELNPLLIACPRMPATSPVEQGGEAKFYCSELVLFSLQYAGIVANKTTSDIQRLPGEVLVFLSPREKFTLATLIHP